MSAKKIIAFFRIISTYVENTLFDLHLQLLVSGSSPHTWRIHFVTRHKHGSSRIISTYVENTHQLRNLPNQDQDHLHIRGEYIYIVFSKKTIKGSSPHTWRIPVSLYESFRRIRIISTYVENTQIVEKYQSSHQDHLHIRGEYM